MFLAPLTLPRDAEAKSAPSRPSSKSARMRASSTHGARTRFRSEVPRAEPAIERAAVQCVLLAWLLVGCGVVLLFPQWMSTRSAGASMVFWLIGAPLIDLAWCRRRSLIQALRGCLRARRPQRRVAAIRRVSREQRGV